MPAIITAATGGTAVAATAINPWREAKDDSGAVYYYNETTGESSWEKPEDMTKFENSSTSTTSNGTTATPEKKEKKEKKEKEKKEKEKKEKKDKREKSGTSGKSKGKSMKAKKEGSKWLEVSRSDGNVYFQHITTGKFSNDLLILYCLLRS